MGVFARFRRKAKGTVEASTEECTAGCVTVGTEDGASGEPAKDALKVKEPVEASGDEAAGSVDSDESKDSADGDEAGSGSGSGSEKAPPASAAADASGPSGPAGSSGAEQLEIPKQQSVEEAADNEAGEGARQ